MIKTLSKQDRHYLQSIKGMLEVDAVKIDCGPSLYSEALHDNIEWLDTILFKQPRSPK